MACGSRARSHERLKSLREGGGVVICDFKKGARVEIIGLQNASCLNGHRGTLGNYDEACGRWDVCLDGMGSKKIKEFNLAPCITPSTKKLKLCKFGQRCHRPQCWFWHDDEQQRCKHFVQLWQRVVGKQPSQSCQSPVASSQLEDDIAKLKADSFKHEA